MVLKKQRAGGGQGIVRSEGYLNFDFNEFSGIYSESALRLKGNVLRRRGTRVHFLLTLGE
jgi:hypothetical protein